MPEPASGGSWPVSTQILLWGPDLELKRGREAAPFRFQILAPKKDLCGNGPGPPEAGSGTRDPQPHDKNRAGALQNWAVPLFGGPFWGPYGLCVWLPEEWHPLRRMSGPSSELGDI